jgi:hypothetical protein
MKKLFATFFITLLASIFAFSQTETKPAADWQIFAPVGEEFSVETPVTLAASVFTNDELNRRYLNIFEGTYYFIISDSPKKDRQCEFVQNFAKIHGQSGRSEKIGDFETAKFGFSDGSNFFHTILIAKAKSRCYAFQAVSPTVENPSVERFFKSLKLKNAHGKTVELPEEKAINVTIRTEETSIRQADPVSRLGSSIGSGSGDGSVYKPTPETKPTPSPTPNGKTNAVKILTKPRANYTDFARFYEITGKVRLRVTFSANGTIGSITPISRLPFGLTEEAIAAARSITFEPAMRAGTPYSVTKPVEYSFVIY